MLNNLCKSLFWVVLCVSSTLAVSQNYKEQFYLSLKINDTLAMTSILSEWQNVDDKDAELFVANFNYYIQQSKKSVIRLTTEDPEGPTILLQSADGESIANLGSEEYFDEAIIEQAFSWINRGLQLHPTRLDMHFGKIYLLGQLERYSEFTQTIIDLINYSHSIHNQWLWSDNVPLKDGEIIFLTSLQDYQVELYNTYNDHLLDNMEQIALKILEFHPNHVESLANIGLIKLIQKKYPEAIHYLEKASMYAPHDFVVLGNLGEVYTLTGNKSKAKKAYKTIIKHGDEQDKLYARSKLAEL